MADAFDIIAKRANDWMMENIGWLGELSTDPDADLALALRSVLPEIKDWLEHGSFCSAHQVRNPYCSTCWAGDEKRQILEASW